MFLGDTKSGLRILIILFKDFITFYNFQILKYKRLLNLPISIMLSERSEDDNEWLCDGILFTIEKISVSSGNPTWDC